MYTNGLIRTKINWCYTGCGHSSGVIGDRHYIELLNPNWVWTASYTNNSWYNCNANYAIINIINKFLFIYLSNKISLKIHRHFTTTLEMKLDAKSQFSYKLTAKLSYSNTYSCVLTDLWHHVVILGRSTAAV